MMKLILMVTVAAGAVAVAPRPVAAASCTTGYVKCLNDSAGLGGALETMADIECFAEYTGCVAKKIRVL